ncbi:glycerophosphodiester phosphodiesterase family protein [Nitrosospira sp. NpAV]|uniref:glycerophosphodiester phosphodiesterase family protein n=1 Tax=Nitrosospira sp. NpAV TaxID=58133 RepID=UPI001E4C4428|nr:glycerophosphodiester phosphodiesterase family protein [Nitrosospira sp. NpAV]
MFPKNFTSTLAAFALLAVLSIIATASSASRHDDDGDDSHHGESRNSMNIQLGPRPFFLVNDMGEGALRNRLKHCGDGPFRKTDFSIGHRGAALQFPEHTKESYEAAVRMGAGIVECDVTFTKDKELVCRHSQCDLHTTTNILDTPLAVKCTRPFTPAQVDAAGNIIQAASAQCCTSDITVEEFKSLKGKMDAFNPAATSVAEYLGGTPNWRTDLYAGPTSGTLLTHKESIQLIQDAGRKNDARTQERQRDDAL